MAQQQNQLDSEKLTCSICMDLLKDPVTTSCGHSYCRDCIKTCWDGGDGEDGKRIYCCPQCAKMFTLKPDLEKNVMLAELVEELEKTGLQAAAADHCYAGAEDVSCDACTGRKMKAVKSCLVCLASYCDNHLQPHYDVAQLKKHQLVEPSDNLQENICSLHDEVKKVFCPTDQQLICFPCTTDDHEGHETVPAAAERTKKQEVLEAIKVSADKTVEDSEKMFTQMIHLIQKRISDVKQQIRSQQETEVSRVEELEEKLEQEIRELERKEAELKQLSDTRDHSQFLHSYPSVSALSESTHASSMNVRPRRHFEDVTAAVKELRDEMQDILRDKRTNISLTITEVDVLLPEPEPKTRDEFLKYSREITLDPNTAHRDLKLTKGDRKVKVVDEGHYPHHPDRFTRCCQVLSKESLTGRCYWEVKWTGDEVGVSVAYKKICKTGTSDECEFGQNDRSWSLYCYSHGYSFLYNNSPTRISGPQSSRIGVYLDHGAGILSFYSVSETMTLLYRVQTTFTEPIHAGVRFSNYGLDFYGDRDTAKFLKLK
ncbi:tripartite motif-containing protein 16-like [Acanthochromis polyacanthus]|uniref:Tripartite motif-containing protein 16-like n=1 Tax=Acanthochromis polyacanthus TaxID=80966 RepID=A0A3Q1FER1_9TELE|nr:tripartite motif-containing protein 16-like [Acanthochromis polyacanthus]